MVTILIDTFSKLSNKEKCIIKWIGMSFKVNEDFSKENKKWIKKIMCGSDTNKHKLKEHYLYELFIHSKKDAKKKM